MENIRSYTANAQGIRKMMDKNEPYARVYGFMIENPSTITDINPKELEFFQKVFASDLPRSESSTFNELVEKVKSKDSKSLKFA